MENAIDYQKLGQKLKAARNDSGFSQRDVAGWLNVTYQNVSSWERGASKIDIDSLLYLCGKYQIDYSTLLDDVSNSERTKKSPAPEKSEVGEDDRTKVIKDIIQLLTELPPEFQSVALEQLRSLSNIAKNPDKQ